MGHYQGAAKGGSNFLSLGKPDIHVAQCRCRSVQAGSSVAKGLLGTLFTERYVHYVQARVEGCQMHC